MLSLNFALDTFFLCASFSDLIGCSPLTSPLTPSFFVPSDLVPSFFTLPPSSPPRAFLRIVSNRRSASPSPPTVSQSGFSCLTLTPPLIVDELYAASSTYCGHS